MAELLLYFVPSGAERLPVVLAVLEQSLRSLKLVIESPGCCRRALARSCRPAGSAQAIPESRVHRVSRREARQLMVDCFLQDLALEHPGIACGTGPTHRGSVPASSVAAHHGFDFRRASTVIAQLENDLGSELSSQPLLPQPWRSAVVDRE